MSCEIWFGDNLPLLTAMPAGSFDLIYVDPPFNTGAARRHTRVRVEATAADAGDRTGFQGRRYQTIPIATRAYADAFDDFIGFLAPRMREAYRLLKPTGSCILHLNCREVHYAKVMMDGIFGRDAFINEIIWTWDYGGRSRRRWPAKHDNLLWYVRDPRRYTFDYDAIDRIPYLAPNLVGAEKAARGKTPTDVWWHTIVPTAGRERTGYPTQKPLGILRRIVRVHSRPGDRVLDFFAGSGTTGIAAHEAGRDAVLIDRSPDALAVMAERFVGIPAVTWHGWPPPEAR